jgi:hypothetical protein
MATLTRPEIAQDISHPSLTLLNSSIPTPFPSNEERLQDEILEELANEQVGFDVESPAGSSRSAESSQRPQNTSYHVLVSNCTIVLLWTTTC